MSEILYARTMDRAPAIVVVGLGYVGLPLAIALAEHFDVTGYDIDAGRIEELRSGHDRTSEVDADALRYTSLRLTAAPKDCRGADLYIVTVPTPVDRHNVPNLSALLAATEFLAGVIEPSKRPTIVYESTVYPGVTEDICGPALEAAGNFVRGRDFRLGYSPERINPGDRTHTIDKIVKVIAGEDEDVIDQLAYVYGSITQAGVFRAASIRAAEAAKAIENAQRDINIAFINEAAQIFSRAGIPIADVLDAARTKWNFLPFEPGLVGGHCIGVDPYYLSHLAHQVGHDPRVILAGRGTNDGMGAWIADRIHEAFGRTASVLVLGLTFKENVPDLRNSRTFDVVGRLEELGHEVRLADPLADPAALSREYGRELNASGPADIVIGAVAHDEYRGLGAEALSEMVNMGGMVADIRGIWKDLRLREDIRRWSL